MTQTCNNCAEIHFGGGVMSPISPLCPPSPKHMIQLSSAV